MNMLANVPKGQPTCVTCRFHTLEAMQGQIQRQMICRRNPPSMNMVTTPQGIQGMTFFPIVQPNIWCFAHEPRQLVSTDKHELNDE